MTTFPETAERIERPRPPAGERSGARSGAVIAAASVGGIAANYFFLLVSGRVLGSHDYGSLAALLGLLTIVLLPTGAVQLAASREVSRRLAQDDAAGAAAFARAIFRLGLIATAPVLALAGALAFPIAALLKIDSAGVVLLAMSGLVTAFALPIALGTLQGYQRFTSVAVLYVLPFALRVVLLVAVVWLGFRLGGAVYAAVGGMIVAGAVAVALIEAPLRRGASLRRPPLRPFLRYLGPVVLGVVGIAVLTNVDVLVVKARFPGDEAGDYAAAAAFARVAFFLPVTILAVLFPRAAARHARGEPTADILGRSLLVTAAFCGLAVLGYGLTGRGLVHLTFGAEFAEGGAFVAPLALAMGLYALANVLVGFHLSQGEARYAWLLAGAVPAQVALLALAPGGVVGVIWANVAAAAALLLAHELLVGSSAPALRAGAVRLWGSRALPRARIREGGLATIGLVAAAVAVTWPLVTGLGSSFLGSVGADASATIWWLWHLDQESGYHIFGAHHHSLTGAPFGFDEANVLNLQTLLPYYPAYLAVPLVGEVAGYNLVVLSGFVLPAGAMYVLARYLGCVPLVAAWAAVVYMIFPAHVHRIEHASLLHIEVLPLTLLAVLAAAKRPSVPRMALVAAAVAAAWLTSGYLGVMAVVGAFACAAGTAMVVKRSRLRILAGTAACAVVATAAVGLLSLAAGGTAGDFRERSEVDISVYGLRPDELVVPTRNLLLGGRLDAYHATRLHGSNPSETANYVGLVTLGLAIAALAVAVRRRNRLDPSKRAATIALVAVVLVALAFSAPSPVGIFGETLAWTPSRVMWEVIPEIRVASRWIALAMAGLVPLAALGLQYLYTALAARHSGRHARFAPAAVAVGALVASVLELGASLEHKAVSTEPPPQYAAVKRAPHGLLAEYPLKRSDIYAFWQRDHGRPLVNGAPRGTFANDVERTLVDPDAPGTAERLAALGVTAIVTRTGVMHFASDEPPEFIAASWGPGYALLSRHADGSSVWRVTAAPAPAVTALPSESFADGVVHEDGWVGHPMTGQTGYLELFSRREQVVELRFDALPLNRTQTLVFAGQVGNAYAPLVGRTPVGAVVRVPPGRSRVDLRVEPMPEAGRLALEISAPAAVRTSKAPTLTAKRVSARP